jgi:RNA polymerase sigma factor (TIGR02999 family)
MENDSRDNLTRILKRVAAGDRGDFNDLLEAVYDDLRGLAGHHLAMERRDHTLQPTALVHEAYLRLIDQRNVQWQDRAHFFAIASQMIRRILVDHARSRKASKRGGGAQRLPLSELPELSAGGAGDMVDLVDLDDALQRLARISPVQSDIVELRYFGGLTIEEIAKVTDKGKRTIDREWQGAKAWLFRELHGGVKE